jgi:DNA-binding transcriptional LysR family regulator
MDLQHLRALVVVAETGSVTAAARRLLLTQPAVTKQLSALEGELGGALFDRTRKPLPPTPLGQATLAYARRILQLTDDLRALVSHEAGNLRGELRLGVVHSLASQLVPPLVQELRQQYPGVQLQLRSSSASRLRRAVEDGLLDAAIVLVPPHTHVPADLAATRLAPEPLTLVASIQTPLTGTVAIEALRGYAWVMSRSGCGYRAVLKRTLEAAGIPFTVAVEVLETELQLQLIRAGIGVGIILRRALPPRLQRTGLHTFTVADLSLTLEAWLWHRRTGPVIAVTMPLIEHLVSMLLLGKTTAQRERRAPLAALTSEAAEGLG